MRTNFFGSTAFVMLTMRSFDIFANAGWFTLARVSNIMLWITAVLTVVSGITYFVDSKKLIDFSK